jgi:hypothetical protein
METPIDSFHYRHNPDGSWDSICLHCYQTAAQARSEAELTEAQKQHVCGPLASRFEREGFIGGQEILVRQ